jgi:hypothetical protein
MIQDAQYIPPGSPLAKLRQQGKGDINGCIGLTHCSRFVYHETFAVVEIFLPSSLWQANVKFPMNPIPVRLPDELHARVDSMAKKMSISRSAVLRMAIQQWIDAVAVHGENPLLKGEERPETSVEE